MIYTIRQTKSPTANLHLTVGHKLFIILFWTLLAASANSQTTSPAIYVGEVNCGKTNAPQKTDKEKPVTIFGYHLMDSSNAIEIYLTEHSIGPGYYTRQVRLYYDNKFRIEYWDTDLHLDTVTFQFPLVQKKSSEKYPLDSIFSLLVASGAFHLPHLTDKEVQKNYN